MSLDPNSAPDLLESIESCSPPTLDWLKSLPNDLGALEQSGPSITIITVSPSYPSLPANVVNDDAFNGVPTPDACIVYITADSLGGDSENHDVGDDHPPAQSAKTPAITAVSTSWSGQGLTKPSPGTLPGQPVKPARARKWPGDDGIADFDAAKAKASGLAIQEIQAIQRTKYRIRALIQALKWTIETQVQVSNLCNIIYFCD